PGLLPCLRRTPHRQGWTPSGRLDQAVSLPFLTGQKRRVERPGTRARDQEKDAAHDLRVLRADLVQDGPDANLRRNRGWGERQGSEEKPRLGGEYRHEHLDDERNRDEPCTEAEDQQQAAHDFQPAHEVRGEDRKPTSSPRRRSLAMSVTRSRQSPPSSLRPTEARR